MKKDIHPKLNTKTTVTCACGNSFETMSTLPNIQVEICSACHPFFTGQQKYVDTEGRIEKFEKKRKIAQEKQQNPSKKKSKSKTQESSKTLKQMLKTTSTSK